MNPLLLSQSFNEDGTEVIFTYGLCPDAYTPDYLRTYAYSLVPPEGDTTGLQTEDMLQSAVIESALLAADAMTRVICPI